MLMKGKKPYYERVEYSLLLTYVSITKQQKSYILFNDIQHIKEVLISYTRLLLYIHLITFTF